MVSSSPTSARVDRALVRRSELGSALGQVMRYAPWINDQSNPSVDDVVVVVVALLGDDRVVDWSSSSELYALFILLEIDIELLSTFGFESTDSDECDEEGTVLLKGLLLGIVL